MNRSSYKVMLKLIGLVKPLLHIMILAIIMGVVGYLAAIFITILGGLGILTLTSTHTPLSLNMILGMLILCAVSRGILRYTEQMCNHYIAFKILALIRNKIFNKLRKLAPAKLEGKDKGNLITIITSDIELLEVFYAHTISPVVIGLLTSIFMIVFIGQYHIILGMIAAVGYFTVGIILPKLFAKSGSKEGLAYRNAFGEMNSYYLDSLKGMREIIQFKTGEQRLAKINHYTDSLLEKQRILKRFEGINRGITDSTIFLFTILMLLASVLLKQEALLSSSGVLICTIAMMGSFGPVVALSSLSNNLYHTIASGNRVLDLLEEAPILEEVEGKNTIQFTNIEIANVDFSYGEEKILEQLDCTIPKGRILGIFGKSGSGKSTLLKLIMRFFDVNTGSIHVSGVNVKEINTSNLRNMMAYVTQDTYLFNDTIENNIRIGKEDASNDEIIQAAKKASIHEFIISLPSGYKTEVGELGENLSGGERQRIGLARAFLNDAPVILLDEPTSNLDSLNEAIILKSIQESREDKTILLVSHRKSTMGIVDETLSLTNTMR